MRKYTDEEKKKYWMARCPECGWRGLTVDCSGFGPIADTGDYDDGYYPKCGATIGSDDEEPRRLLLWFIRRLTFYKTRKEAAEKRWIAKMEKRLEEEIGA